MTFRMDKKKNLLVLVTVLFILVMYLVSIVKGWSQNGHIIGAVLVALGTCVVFLILDFKKEVTVSEKGLYMRQHIAQYDLTWKRVRPLEYSGKKWAPAFNTMVIHTSTGEKLYVDYTFKDYKKAWLCIAQHYQTYGEQPIIDKEIWEIAQEEST